MFSIKNGKMSASCHFRMSFLGSMHQTTLEKHLETTLKQATRSYHTHLKARTVVPNPYGFPNRTTLLPPVNEVSGR